MDHRALIDRYAAGGALLREAVQGLSEEQLRAAPIAGRWSTQQLVCHVADFEPVFADRMKRVIAEDEPTLLGADENRFALRLAYNQRLVAEELALVEAARSQLTRILRTLAASDFERRGRHNEAGPMSLGALLEKACAHLEHHVSFVPEKRQVLGL